MLFRSNGMDFDLELVCQELPEMKTIRRRFEKEVERLDKRFQGIEGCKIAIGLPFRHRYPGNLYEFRIEVDIPGQKLAVGRSPSANGATANIFSLIREAFDEMERKLDACSCAVESDVSLPTENATGVEELHRKVAHLHHRSIPLSHSDKDAAKLKRRAG